MPKKSRAAYMRRYRASKRVLTPKPTSTRGERQKTTLKEAWNLGRCQLAEQGTPIYVRLNRSGKITLKAEFPGALAHALIILSGYRTGELSWMYDLLCAAVFPDSICRRWKTMVPAFWRLTGLVPQAPVAAPFSHEEVAELVREGEEIRKSEYVLPWSKEQLDKYFRNQPITQERYLDWLAAPEVTTSWTPSWPKQDLDE
jgi:hypothetical protein